MKNQALIQKLNDCIAACLHCSDACLETDNPKMMVSCIRTDRECATICQATANLLAQDGIDAAKLVKLCAETCRRCEKECSQHNHDHCKKCAAACRACAAACESYAA